MEQKTNGNDATNNGHGIFLQFNYPNTTKHRIYNLMKIQTKGAWVHVTLAMQKASLSIVSLNQQLIRKVPFSQI